MWTQLSAVPDSYEKHTMLLVLKWGESLVDDIGKNKRKKDLFVIWDMDSS